MYRADRDDGFGVIRAVLIAASFCHGVSVKWRYKERSSVEDVRRRCSHLDYRQRVLPHLVKGYLTDKLITHQSAPCRYALPPMTAEHTLVSDRFSEKPRLTADC